MMVKGIVIEGKKEGRELGFPTANIRVSRPLEFEPGIYAGRISIEGKEYGGAFYLAGNDIIEAFLFDFSGNLYGRELGVSVLKKIRDNIVFESDAHAKEQITKDIKDIQKCLQEL